MLYADRSAAPHPAVLVFRQRPDRIVEQSVLRRQRLKLSILINRNAVETRADPDLAVAALHERADLIAGQSAARGQLAAQTVAAIFTRQNENAAAERAGPQIAFGIVAKGSRGAALEFIRSPLREFAKIHLDERAVPDIIPELIVAINRDSDWQAFRKIDIRLQSLNERQKRGLICVRRQFIPEQSAVNNREP